jgi:hypothetical protein
MSRRDTRTEPPAPGYGVPGAPWNTPDPDLPGPWRWGYNSYPVRVYESREVHLASVYRKHRGGGEFAPIDYRCEDCAAGPGERCWDMRSRRRLLRLRPHLARRRLFVTGPARIIRWPVFTVQRQESTLW